MKTARTQAVVWRRGIVVTKKISTLLAAGRAAHLDSTFTIHGNTEHHGPVNLLTSGIPIALPMQTVIACTWVAARHRATNVL